MWLDVVVVFFFFKQKTAYEMRISDWSSDVCSSDLDPTQVALAIGATGLVVIALVLLFVDPRLLPLVAVPAGAGLAVDHSLRNGPARQIDQMERIRQADLALRAASRTEAAASDLADTAIAVRRGAGSGTIVSVRVDLAVQVTMQKNTHVQPPQFINYYCPQPYE